ncbi:tigger transposable element-derived 6 [Brachionus plicatilis]|uniref:Tigger transposable element-derived 6 n=1 Tax=Brachionus plicatilis TaxID=10195 RepID=A0A3M7SM78_BRAPC|nr:tigger transposable element-derived 6 [Brachionus plicatilis]
MVRTYIPKAKKYKPQDLTDAIKSVTENRLNPTQASTYYNVPRQTIVNHLNGRYASTKTGRPTIFSVQEEEFLVNIIEKIGEWGFYLDRNSLKDIVKNFAIFRNKTCHFKSGVPGDDWVYNFKARWKHRLSKGVAQNITISKKSDNDESLDNFYSKLREKILEIGLEGTMENIFNDGQTDFSFSLDSKNDADQSDQTNHQNLNNDTFESGKEKCHITPQSICSSKFSSDLKIDNSNISHSLIESNSLLNQEASSTSACGFTEKKSSESVQNNAKINGDYSAKKSFRNLKRSKIKKNLDQFIKDNFHYKFEQKN